MSADVVFSLDGADVAAQPGESIWDVTERLGTHVPHMCSGMNAHYRADGNCRLCMVEIEGERTLAASCIRKPDPGMVVRTATPRAERARKLVMELLVADHPKRADSHDANSRFWRLADFMSQTTSRFPAREQHAPDLSHPAMAVNLDACIQCTNCVRACREVQVNDVIGMAYRGAQTKVVFDIDDAMGASTCVGCGECVQACPTGALMPAEGVGRNCARPDPSIAFARTAASVASSPTTSRTTNSCTSAAATGPPTKVGCASRDASASTT